MTLKKLLLLLVAMLPMVASADDSGTCGDNLTWAYTESTKTLTIEGTGDMNDYVSYQRRPWESFHSLIEKIIISEGVTSISRCAFIDCSGLTSITIPNSVTSIGESAFLVCTGLTAVYISDLAAWCNISFSGVIANPLYYAHHLFLNGVEIKNLVIPNSVTSIGESAFYGCSALTSVTIPNSVTSIERSTFSGCSALTSITIPNSVTIIGGGAFYGCCSLTSVTIPNSVTSIEGSTFSGCSALTSITIPNSVTSIGGSAFRDCSALTSITIPNSVTSIGEYAFEGCI
jgi:hypothetical protein